MCCQVRTIREHRVTLLQWLVFISWTFCIPWWSSIPVITSARSSPFFSLKTKAHRFLKCIDCNYVEFRNQDRTVGSSNSLQIFHQNIRELRSKADESINSLEIDNINLQVLCFGEHHVEEKDLLHLTLPGYILGWNCCSQNLENCEVCAFLLVKPVFQQKLHITVKKRFWKFMLLNYRLNHLN